MAFALQVSPSQAIGPGSGGWKCRTRWGLIGVAAGVVLVAVSTQELQSSFGPSRGALISLGALAGGVGGLILATDKC